LIAVSFSGAQWVRRTLIALLLLSVLATACLDIAADPANRGTSTQPRELLVFAASSLTDPFEEIARLFGSANGNVRVTLYFGGTPQLRTQIEQGARADVLVSANQEQIDLARRSGIVAGEALTIAHNRLVVIVPKGNPGAVERLEDLARPGLKLVLAQSDVPVGQYARLSLGKMAADPRFGAGFDARALANLRSEEANVRQVVAKVQLGEADAAIVYASDVSTRLAEEVVRLDVPDPYNVLASYPAVLIKETREPELARSFLAFLVSDEARAVLSKNNFVVPEKRAIGQIVPRG
jgi:molybdate transport system substrate-binding protein